MHHSRNGFLTERGYAELAQRRLVFGDQLSLGLTSDEVSVSLDLPVSVSALFEFELNDRLLEEQYQRFINGS